MKASGRNPSDFRIGMIRSWFVSDDPTQERAAIKAGQVYRTHRYAHIRALLLFFARGSE